MFYLFTWMCCLYICGDTIAISYFRRTSSSMITSSSMSALRYAPYMFNTAIYLPLCTFITAVRSSNFNDMVGDLASSFLIFVIFRLLSAHALPLIDLSCFYLKNIGDLGGSLICSLVSDPYARCSMASWLCIWVISFMTASAPFFGYFFSPLFSYYCVIVKCDILFWYYFPWVFRCASGGLWFFPVFLRVAENIVIP